MVQMQECIIPHSRVALVYVTWACVALPPVWLDSTHLEAGFDLLPAHKLLMWAHLQGPIGKHDAGEVQLVEHHSCGVEKTRNCRRISFTNESANIHFLERHETNRTLFE